MSKLLINFASKSLTMAQRIIQVMLSEEAERFILSQDVKAQKKITYNIRAVESGLMDSTILKKLEGSDIWEFRTLFNGIHYRLFAFWDIEQRSLIIATHGIVKKTKKTPKQEIEKAERIRNEYFKTKR